MYTAVLYSKEDAVKFLRDQPQADRVYPLTPDAKAELMYNTQLPMLDPLDYYTDYSHRRVLARIRSVEKTIHRLIDIDKNLSDAGKETFRSVFHLALASAMVNWESLRKISTFLVYNGFEWQKIDESGCAFRILFQRIVQDRTGIFSHSPRKNGRISPIVKFFQVIMLKKLSKTNCIWVTGLEYGLGDLSKHLKQIDPDVFVFYYKTPSGNPLMEIIRYFFTMLNFSGDDRQIGIAPSIAKRKNLDSTVQKILRESVTDLYLEHIMDIISKHITDCVNYTESLIDYTNQLFQWTKPKALIAYYLRWYEGAALGAAAKQNQVPSIMISHGSHPVPENITSQYELENLAKGLIVSPLATSTVVQSPISEWTAKKFMPNLERIRYQPIMWGYKNINGERKKKTIQRTILHAGTYKVLGARPWIYETSNEFVRGLQFLVKTVNELENTHLIIRIRDNQECSVSSLRKLLPLSEKCEIKTCGSFLDDLKNADLLVSFSSTTIEEALYARKPVALFGGSARYYHLPGSSSYPDKNKRSAVYHLTKENMIGMIPAIAAAHSNKPLTNKELSEYVWPDSVPGINTFLSNLIDRRENKN